MSEHMRNKMVERACSEGCALIGLEVGGGFYVQVVIAALNEEPGIGRTIVEIQDCLGFPKFIVVDGNSRDRTVEIAKNLGAEIFCQDGVGKGDALSKGFEYLDPCVKYVVITDADFTYPAEYVPEMIGILERNPGVGMVCGNRFNGRVDPGALLNKFSVGNRILAFAHNVLNGVPLRDPLTGLRVVRAKIVRDWKVRSKGFDVEVELNHQVERKGYTIVEIPIQYRKRLGEKKLKLRHGIVILKRILLETTY
jgi:glycosyltransferase involved in cell wall biosynthesis